MPSYISKITLPSGTTYDIKDAQAWTDIADIREQLANKTAFHICTSASDTPVGVTWINDQGQTIVGTLTATNVQNKSWIYLVPATKANLVSDVTVTQSYFDQTYMIVKYYTDIPGTGDRQVIAPGTQVSIYECVEYNYENSKIETAVLAYKGSFDYEITVTTNGTEWAGHNDIYAITSENNDGFNGIQYVNNGIYSEYIVVDQGNLVTYENSQVTYYNSDHTKSLQDWKYLCSHSSAGTGRTIYQFDGAKDWTASTLQYHAISVEANVKLNNDATISGTSQAVYVGSASSTTTLYPITSSTFTTGTADFKWEKIGDTSIDLSNLGLLAFKDSASGQILIPTSAAVSGIPNTYTFTGTSNLETSEVSAGDIGTVTNGTAASVDTSKFSGGSFTSGTFSQGTLPSVTDSTTQISVTSETLDLSKVLTGPFSQGTLPSHGSDSFTPASIASGFFTANIPTAVTLKAHKHTYTPAGTVVTNGTTSKTVTLTTTLTTITVS